MVPLAQHLRPVAGRSTCFLACDLLASGPRPGRHLWLCPQQPPADHPGAIHYARLPPVGGTPQGSESC